MFLISSLAWATRCPKLVYVRGAIPRLRALAHRSRQIFADDVGSMRVTDTPNIAMAHLLISPAGGSYVPIRDRVMFPAYPLRYCLISY